MTLDTMPESHSDGRKASATSPALPDQSDKGKDNEVVIISSNQRPSGPRVTQSANKPHDLPERKLGSINKWPFPSNQVDLTASAAGPSTAGRASATFSGRSVEPSPAPSVPGSRWASVGRGSMVPEPDDGGARSTREESTLFVPQDPSFALMDLEEEGIQEIPKEQINEHVPATVKARWDKSLPGAAAASASAARSTKRASGNSVGNHDAEVVEIKKEAADDPGVPNVPHHSTNGTARNNGVRTYVGDNEPAGIADLVTDRERVADEQDRDYDSDDEFQDSLAGDLGPEARGGRPSNRRKKPTSPKKNKGKGKAPLASGLTNRDASDTGDVAMAGLGGDNPEDVVGGLEYIHAANIQQGLEELRFLQGKRMMLEGKATRGQLGQTDALELRMVCEQILRDQERLGVTDEDLELESSSAITTPEPSIAGGGRTKKGQSSKQGGGGLVAKLMGKKRGRPPATASLSFDGRAAAAKRASTKAGGRAAKRTKTDNQNPIYGVSRQVRSKRRTDEKTQMMFEMLRDADPIMARQGQGDIPLPPKLRASNVKDQVKQIKENYARNPDDQSRVNADLKLLGWARGIFGRGRAKAKNGQWVVMGMKTALYHYQLYGAAWMLQRERGEDGVFGGIQADAMGMGKTLMCIALMMGNAPSEADRKSGKGVTLIVCPASAISQWEAELNAHCKKRLTILAYRESKDIDTKVLEKCDVILTSYNEVQRSHPSQAVMNELASLGLNPSEYSEKLGETLGNLFKVYFHRVILDEGHAIKNYHSATSKACIHLRSKYHWIVSGTPIQNTLAELYPYMRFLRCRFSAAWIDFKKKYGLPNDENAAQELVDLMTSITLKRNLDAIFLGLPVHTLPMSHPMPIRWVSFSREEQLIYRRIESRFRDDLNRRLVEGNVKKGMVGYFSLLLRLRQATSHPYLLEALMMDFFVLEDIRWLRRELQKLGGKRPLVEQIGRWCEQMEDGGGVIPAASGSGDNNDDNNGGEGSSINNAAAAVPPGIKDSRHGLAFHLDRQLALAEGRKDGKSTVCCVCIEAPMDPVWTTCGHVFCRVCIEAKAAEEAHDGAAIAHCPHPHCGVEIDAPDVFEMPLAGGEEEEEEEEDGSDTDGADDEGANENGNNENGNGNINNSQANGKSSGKGKKTTKAAASNAASKPKSRPRKHQRGRKYVAPQNRGPRKRGDDVNCFQPRSENGYDRFLREADKNAGNTPLTPSAKTTAVMEAIDKWQKEAPEDKIIVFTQFVVFAQVLGRVLQEKGTPFLYFFGEMGQEDKAEAVRDFHDRDEIKVMIVSMRCGGQALNLTCANRVILVDVWYNHAMEQQAFGRVFRIGQKKETYFLRIMVRNSVDVPLYDMQEEKMKAIGKAVREHDSSLAPWGFTAEDISSLLGRVTLRDGPDGKKQVVVESDYEDNNETDAEGGGGDDTASGGNDWAGDFRVIADVTNDDEAGDGGDGGDAVDAAGDAAGGAGATGAEDATGAADVTGDAGITGDAMDIDHPAPAEDDNHGNAGAEDEEDLRQRVNLLSAATSEEQGTEGQQPTNAGAAGTSGSANGGQGGNFSF